jgi:excisionase family DNA binding protein
VYINLIRLTRGKGYSVSKLFLTVEEAAGLIGISRAQAYKFLRDGTWVSVKLGRLRRISRAWLTDWVAGLTESAESGSGARRDAGGGLAE